MKNKQYIELSEPNLSQIENRFDYLPDEKEIHDISPSLDKHTLKRTLSASRKRLKEISNSITNN